MMIGDMVRHDGTGPMLKVISKANGEARCVWFDQRGTLHYRTYETSRLAPFWLSIGPRTTWPEVTDMPDAPATLMAAPASKKPRNSSKRPRSSNKIKGRRNAAA